MEIYREFDQQTAPNVPDPGQQASQSGAQGQNQTSTSGWDKIPMSVKIIAMTLLIKKLLK